MIDLGLPRHSRWFVVLLFGGVGFHTLIAYHVFRAVVRRKGQG